MSSESTFVHLRVHTEYSLVDGVVRGIGDYGNSFGVPTVAFLAPVPVPAALAAPRLVVAAVHGPGYQIPAELLERRYQLGA